MSMDDLDTFSLDDGPKIWQKREEIGQCRGRGDGDKGYVVDLQPRHNVADAYAVWKMCMCDNDDLQDPKLRARCIYLGTGTHIMPEADKIGAEEIYVAFNPAYDWVEEVAYHSREEGR